MKDKIVEVSKVDSKGKGLEGARLQVIDEQGNILDEWNSSNTTHLVSGLEVGKTYILHEVTSPIGYALSEDTKFTVNDDNNNQTITLVNELIKVSALKVDENDNPVEGATLNLIEIVEDNEIVLYEWISTEEAEDLSSYVEWNKTYIIRETQEPVGYNQESTDIEFTVSGSETSPQVINIYNSSKDYYLSIKKVDAADETKVLTGVQFTLFNEDGSIVIDVDGNKCVGSTNEEGLVTFHINYASGLYLQETKTIEGYQLNDEKLAINLQTASESNEIELVLTNQAIEVPETGDGSNMLLWGSTMVASIAAIGYLIVYNKKRRNIF